MFESRVELLEQIRLGEDSYLELKSVRFSGKNVAGPDRKDLADELAAFANSRGGVCVLGVDDESRDVEGIPQNRLETVESLVREVLTDSIEPPLDASVAKITLPDQTGEDRPVVRIDVPKSLFVHRSPRGYFQRIGSTKREMSPEALARLFQHRSQARLIRFDEQVVPGTVWSDLEEPLWQRFLGESSEDAKVTLQKLRILTRDQESRERVSVAGVLMCSREPEKWLPGAQIEAVRYRGSERDANYQVDAQLISGPADEQIRRAISFVDLNMWRKATKEPERREMPQFSLRAVFEAVVNAVAHRDYSIYGSKIRLFLFDDRLELYSPGRLPNSLTIDSLPLRQSTRNELLTTLLGRIPVEPAGSSSIGRSYFLEKRGEGVPIILRESRELAGRQAEFRLIDDAELLLTIWSATATNR